jgi:hypothetical protein
MSTANLQMLQYIHMCHVIWMMSQTFMILASWAIMLMWVLLFIFFTFCHMISIPLTSINTYLFLPSLFHLLIPFSFLKHSFNLLFFETFIFYFLSCLFAKRLKHMMFWTISKHRQTFVFYLWKMEALFFFFVVKFLCVMFLMHGLWIYVEPKHKWSWRTLDISPNLLFLVCQLELFFFLFCRHKSLWNLFVCGLCSYRWSTHFNCETSMWICKIIWIP